MKTQLLKPKFLLLTLLGFLSLFSCTTDDPTSTPRPISIPPLPIDIPPLPIDYGISGNFYIGLTNTSFELIQKGSITGPSNFNVSPPLPNGLSLDMTNGNISGKLTTASLPTSYTITAVADSNTYTNMISLGVAPAQIWVTNTNSLNSYLLTAFVVGDGSKQTGITWSSSHDTIATVSNGIVNFKPTKTGVNVVITAMKGSDSGNVSFTINRVKEVDGEKVITDDKGNVYLSISDGTQAITTNQFQSQGLTSLVIPSGVKTINNLAFQENQLTRVVISDGVTYIGYRIFANNKLTNVVIPDSLTFINVQAFENNFLTHVTIPNSIRYISYGAFYNNKLTNVVIPNSVDYIDDLVFQKNQLTTVFIGDGVTNIGNDAFTSNPNLVEVSLKQSLYTELSNKGRINAVFGNQKINYITQ